MRTISQSRAFPASYGFSLVVALLFAAVSAVTIRSASEDHPVLPVGVAQVDITPDYPVRLSGFGGRRTESEGVNQRIWAKALSIRDEKAEPAILITADNVCVPDDITREVARRLSEKIGLKAERLTVTATHTHTAPMLKNVCPTLFGVPIPEPHQANIDRYTKEFTDALEKVALEAHEATRPGRLFWGNGSVNFAVNRRTPGGPVDHDLPVLVIKDSNDKVRAVYFSYACHCVTLSDNKISGDWAGFAQERVQDLFPGAIALASVGCGADSNPSSGVTGSNLAVCNEQGTQIANEIKRLFDESLSPITTAPEIKYARLDLPLAPARSRAEWEERAKRNDAVGYHAKVNLARLDKGEEIPTKINYPVQSWVFGDELAIVFLPGETVVDYSLRLKRELDRSRLWVNGYSNDGRAYIPSERILKEGGYEGGEAMIYYDFPQFFAPGLEQKIIDTVHAQVPASFKAPPGTEGSRPLTPKQALKAFHTKPGLEVQLVASEPLIQAPVAIDWSADGKLWVCEMNDYPSGMDQNWQPGGRVKFLEDTDGDGQYDKATLFAEGIPFPTGITAWGKGIFIAAAPDVLYAQDTDGDGRADKIERIFTGFFTDNFQARVNSLSIGLDNWIYAANGLLGGTIETLPNSLFSAAGQKVHIRNRDFRFHPVTGKMEVVSGLTQQGRARDDWGNWFGCDNSHLLLNYPVTERYIRRNPHVAAPASVRNLASEQDGNRIYPTSRLLERFNDPGHANRATSACGLGIYRDTLLGEEFYGNTFTCEPVHNLVHRRVIEIKPVVTSHRANDEKDSEFLSSTDNWFRPVQARTGPDGALYVVDMYRFLIEHPRWIPAARLAQIDIRAGADKGRIYRVVKTGGELRPIRDLTKLEGASLAAALDTANGIERDRVHVELLTRNDKKAAPALRKLAATSKIPQVRVQALSMAEGLDGGNLDAVLNALGDSHPQVRLHAVRLSEEFLREGGRDAERLLARLADLTGDSSLIVLRQLAYSLGESEDPRAGEMLGTLARKWVANAEMRGAILSSSMPHASAILNAVLSLPENTTGRGDWIGPMIATVVNSPDSQALPGALNAILPENRPANLQALGTVLDALDRRRVGIDSIVAAGSPLKQRFNLALAQAIEIARNHNAPEDQRRLAISLAGRNGSTAELELLAALSRESESIRRAALASLKRQKDLAVARLLIDDWQQTSPSARTEIVSLLLDREEWTLELLKAVKGGTIKPHEISLTDRQRLAGLQNAELRTLAGEVLPAQASTGREEVVTRYREAAARQGNAAQGATIFANNCASCHALNGVGHAVGPDLAPLRAKDAEYWLKNILDPNAVIEPRFVNYQVELKDDRSLSGVIRSETANSLVLVSGAGVEENVPRTEIVDIRASSLSLMPEGLESVIGVAEMADLIAYIKAGSKRKEVAGNSPKTATQNANGVLMLKAQHAEIYGDSITYEPPFQNIGMWHGEDDHLLWTVQVDKAGPYDVYLDYACAASSAGNSFVLSTGSQTVEGTISATGGDWSNYKQVAVGKLQLEAGTHRVIFRPGPNLKGALVDLRTIALAPPGKRPEWPAAAPSATEHDVLRDPASVARFILDASRPDAARSAAVNANPQFAAALITEMTRDLQPGTPEEYRRIPWIWQVAIACGKRNDAGQIKGVLEASLPEPGEPLHDWQSVVIGGGIINGLSLRGLWPGERLQEILGSDSDLKARWERSLDLASEMTDNEKVPTGTRYDALRMIALDSWEERGAQLLRYLGKGVHGELQMGAVSGLVDVQSPEATAALIGALDDLEGGNRNLALDGLLRGDDRAKALLRAVEEGRIRQDSLGEERLRKLRER